MTAPARLLTADAAAEPGATGPATKPRRGDPDILTVDEAADLLGLNRHTLYNAIACQTVPHRRIGRRILLYRPALLDWLSCKGASRER
jgi:excisionase family DNA binding protein